MSLFQPLPQPQGTLTGSQGIPRDQGAGAEYRRDVPRWNVFRFGVRNTQVQRWGNAPDLGGPHPRRREIACVQDLRMWSGLGRKTKSFTLFHTIAPQPRHKTAQARTGPPPLQRPLLFGACLCLHLSYKPPNWHLPLQAAMVSAFPRIVQNTPKTARRCHRMPRKYSATC